MRVLITGIRGQDGSFLAEWHQNNGDEVWGTVSKQTNFESFDRDKDRILSGWLEDAESARQLLDEINPDRVYHLAAKHHSSDYLRPLSSEIKKEMFNCHVEITKNILDWQVKNPNSRSLIALSSQMYTAVERQTLITEHTVFQPSTYYGETKLQALNLMREYRQRFKVKTYGAIFFNHTSVRSKSQFLFPVLAKEITKVLKGESSQILLNDPTSSIDICHASEVCQGIYTLLNQENACDVIFTSGKLVQISRIISSTLKLFEYKGETKLLGKTPSGLYRKLLYGDSSHAMMLLNWKAKLKPEEILAEQVMELLKTNV